MNNYELPTCEQLQTGIRAFEENEKRKKFYYDALAQVSAGWGQPFATAAGVKLLLDEWHQAFYRFGAFDPQLLEQTNAANFVALDSSITAERWRPCRLESPLPSCPLLRDRIISHKGRNAKFGGSTTARMDSKVDCIPGNFVASITLPKGRSDHLVLFTVQTENRAQKLIVGH